jgi:23S rRNA (adenine2030-N6)-methyltransferase
MLSYQHAYHAGNFADVMKHMTLCLICDYMIQKDKPLFYLETHSGRGQYDLTQAIAQKTGEFKEGVSRVWETKHNLPAACHSWLNVVEKYNSQQQLVSYPGSPLFALESLRDDDRFNFCELHPEEYQFLKQLPSHNKHVTFLFKDGIEHLKAALPPKEKRGLIFIDPSYELKQEYQSIPEMINQAYKKFSTGVYCLWYPIIKDFDHKKLIRHMINIGCSDQLRIELILEKNTGMGMRGCGLWILNPPYLLKNQMQEVLSVLIKHLGPRTATYHMYS